MIEVSEEFLFIESVFNWGFRQTIPNFTSLIPLKKKKPTPGTPTNTISNTFENGLK